MKIGVSEKYLVEITKKLIGYLIQRGASPVDAQDIAQDSLLKLLEIEDVIPTEKLQPWLFRIGFNRYLDLYRTRKRRHEIIQSFGPSLIKETSQENYEQLYQAWEHLTFNQRTLLLLKYEEELNLAEMGFRLNRPAASLKTELYRARRALKKEIEKVVEQDEKHP